MVPVDFVEAAEGLLFLAEELRHAHPGDPLLQEGVDAGEPQPDVPVRPPHTRPKQPGGCENHRQDRECHQGKLPIQDQHRRDDRPDGEHVAEDRDHARGEHLIQGLDVTRDPGHETSHRVSIEERQLEALQVSENLASQVLHHPLADPRRQQRARVLEDRGNEK